MATAATSSTKQRQMCWTMDLPNLYVSGAALVVVRFWRGVTRTATFQCSSLRERRRVPRCATMTPCVSSTMWRARKNLWNSPMNMDGQWSALRTIGGKYSRSKIHAVDDTLNSCPFRLSADAKTVYLKDVFSFLWGI